MTRTHIIFDLDGTLVDSAPVCVDILNAMHAARNSTRSICPVEIKPYLSLGGEQMVKALLGDACGNPKSEIEEFRRRYSETLTPSSSLYAGVRQGLARLNACGFTLSICSNKPQHLCDKVVHELDLRHHFELVIGGNTCRRAKPAPDMLAAVFNHYGICPSDCIYVGDSEVDFETAHAFGLPFIFMTYGYGNRDLRSETVHLAHSFDAAIQKIFSLGGGKDTSMVTLTPSETRGVA